MTTLWMVRAGSGAVFARQFEQRGIVAIGWYEAGDFTPLATEEAIRQRVDAVFKDRPPVSRGLSVGQIHRFRNVMQRGDRVTTYDAENREYLLGTITGDCEYDPNLIPKYEHIRRVDWEGRISRDVLGRSSRNSLGSLLTVVLLGEDILRDMEGALRSGRTEAPDAADSGAGFGALYSDFVAEYLDTEQGKAHTEAYHKGRDAGRRNYAAVKEAAARGQDITDLVLQKLLPHANTASNRASERWIHVAPAITKDIRSWYEGSGIARPQEWPDKARLIFEFVERVVENPDELMAACAAFAANPLAKGMQSGMLSPILNALRPERFAIINSKVTKTHLHLTGRKIVPAIAEYPQSNEAVWSVVRENAELLEADEAATGLDPAALVDAFSHWFVAVRDEEHAPDSDKVSTIKSLDRRSATAAGAVLERICPDAAPRTAALEALAHAIRVAHAIAPAAWSITLHPSVLRLNVGGIVVLRIRRDGVNLLVHAPSASEEAKPTIDDFDEGVDFRWVDDTVSVVVPFDRLDPALTVLRPAADALITRALERSTRAPYADIHATGAVAFLRTVGHQTPDPAHVKQAGAGGKVREPEPPPPSPPRNPFYSVEELAAEAHLDVALVDSWIRAINRKGQGILYGPPGTGKTYAAERLARHLVSGGDGIVETVQFHPAYSYEDFIQGLRPVTKGGGQLEFELVPGRFVEFCDRASKSSGPSVLIIDEINRANLAQVFGELMYLLEYRQNAIPLAGGRALRIPPQVRIIGTMNTADRSIALVDHALRRRFAFLKLSPNLETLRKHQQARGREVDGLLGVLSRLNHAIADPHYSIGISFFLRDRLEEELAGIWTGEIEPYLEELFFDKQRVVDDFRWDRIRPEALPTVLE